MSQHFQVVRKTTRYGSASPRRSLLQRVDADERTTATVPAIVHDVLDSPGQPLDSDTRTSMEAHLGHSFANVQVHTDARAGESARAVNALAYTVGRDVVFQIGRYQPDTPAGRMLLAHELVHVMQQAHAVEGFATSRAKPELELDNPGSGAEQEAKRTANWIRYQAAGNAPLHPKVTPTARPALQRAPEDDWDKVYGTRETRSGMSYDEYKKSLGQVKATTEGGLEKKGTQVSSPGGQGFLGHKAAPEIKWEVFLRIYPGLAQDVQESPVKATSGQPAAAAKGQAEREAQDKAVREQRKAQAQEYLASLNQAFKIMKIDTVEAQANYLAHAYVESDQFRQFTETQGSITLKEGTQKWRTQMAPLTVGKYGQLEQNPAEGEFRVNRAYLESTYNSEADAEAKERKRTVNPGGKFEFIGRGPVQVTHNYNYLEVIAMLERTAEQYEEDAHKYAHLMQGGDKQAEKQYQEAAASAGLAREAAQAIKGDPTQAANPKYTFLFSAAYMKKKRADVAVAGANPDEKWTGEDPGSNWVAGAKQTQKAQVEALGTKQAAYKRIYGILLDEAKSSGAIP